MAKAKRISAGHYTVSTSVRAGGYVVNVDYFDHLKAWVAAACWDRHLYSDPLATKRDAMRTAQRMISDTLKADQDRMLVAAYATIDRLKAIAGNRSAADAV